MKASKAFWATLKEVPSDAEIASHQLLLRSGMISKTAAGLYNMLPMGERVVQKIKTIIREELAAIDAQELSLNFLTPKELWEESGRWSAMGQEMIRFTDRREGEFCLSPTNEEAIVDVFRSFVTSYKNLPVNLYQIKSKVRDEIRPRFGLMRCKEFIMKDAYTFSLDKESMDKEYDNYYKAYKKIFERLNLEFAIVEADPGKMASPEAQTHEFQVIADAGEDLIVYSEATGYSANLERAKTKRDISFKKSADAMEEVETHNMSTCEQVAAQLQLPITQTLKTLVFQFEKAAKSDTAVVLLLGDDSLNETKLKNFLGADEIFPAAANVLQELGLVKGYMGPQSLSKTKILIDKAIAIDASYVVGANKENYHSKNFTPERDLHDFEQVDLRNSKEGDLTLDGKGSVAFKRGIEVGHIFQLEDKYTKAMKVTVLNQNGKTIHPLMGCYGIGVTRTMAAAIEQGHDENGIIWPKAIAPFHVYLGKIGKKEATLSLCQEIYQELQALGVEVFFDDRAVSPGIMFKDSDLLGLPLRVVLGERDFEKSGELEVKARAEDEVVKVKRQDLVRYVQEKLAELK